MTDKVVVFVTCGSAEEAGRIARALVEERLAACVNISSPIRSLYRWEGQVCDDQEVLLVIKTARALFDRVRRAVEKRHSYQVPEVICLPVIDGAPNYLNWLTEAVVGDTGPRPRPHLAKPKPTKRKK
ncbi:MAG: divalent-cation tolerance protein CutA [Terriglobia bacterium]